MNELFYQDKAREDFNKARFKELLSQIKGFITQEDSELLSFKDVINIIKPKNEVYKGLQVVPISKIVGSEGRYRDFNKAFFPKYSHLRDRWENIDKAHLKNMILPPIKLYEIGGVYFVRDGNHRVSVAKMQGVKAIDAEVTSLSSEIKLKPHMSKNDLMKAVIKYEKENFYKKTKLDDVIPQEELDFSTPGRFEAILEHIQVHKYFINQKSPKEIDFKEAASSWKKNVFDPIVSVVKEENLLSKFPGRTYGDLYIWIVFHWDELKKKYGEEYPVINAVKDYAYRFGKSYWKQLKAKVKTILINLARFLSGG